MFPRRLLKNPIFQTKQKDLKFSSSIQPEIYDGSCEEIDLILFHVIPPPYPVVGSNRQVPGKLQPGDRREAE
jgi:hypothetical protein